MTYGELKNRVLQYIFSYSIAGDEIQLSYNNQEDYVKQIPGLLNSAQTYIYQVKHFEAAVKLSDLTREDFGDSDMYVLPDDCLKMKPGLILPQGGRLRPQFVRFNNYKLFGGNKLLVPKGMGDKLLMEYWKRSVPLPENIPDSYVLKNTDEVNELLPFYIAAFVVMYDDAFRYSALYNEFETRLQRLAPNPTYVEENEVFDVYMGFNPAWWC